jgi:hypothetical protein
LPERFAEGFEGLVERFAARGFTITAPGPRRFEVEEGQRKPGILDKVKAACGC